MIIFGDVTKTFFMKIFLVGAQVFKNVEVDENMKIDANVRTRDIDRLVVVYELELAIKRDIYGIYAI